jgi:small basic protein
MSDTGWKMMHRGLMDRSITVLIYSFSSNLIEAQTNLIFTGTEVFSDLYLAFVHEFGIFFCDSSLSHSGIMSFDQDLYDTS